MAFKDRREAGKQLAKELGGYRDDDPLILALPRGGVETGYEVAQVLDAELDVVVVRKLGAPSNPEFGFGAIGAGGARVINQDTVKRLGLSETEIQRVEEKEREELKRRLDKYRGDRELPKIKDRTVIIVDDGMATGGTALAAVQTTRTKNPAQLVLAVPVAPPDTADKLRSKVDELICLQTPSAFMAVGQWYSRFDQTTDDEVIELLQQAENELSPGQG